MIVVDTSAWIEFYRAKGNRHIQKLVAQIIAADLVAINGIIQTELLAFAHSKKEYDLLVSDLCTFHWIELRKAVFDLAATLGYNLRRNGITVPSTDLILAATAIESNAELYHIDRHFELIATYSSLKHTYLPDLIPSDL